MKKRCCVGRSDAKREVAILEALAKFKRPARRTVIAKSIGIASSTINQPHWKNAINSLERDDKIEVIGKKIRLLSATGPVFTPERIYTEKPTKSHTEESLLNELMDVITRIVDYKCQLEIKEKEKEIAELKQSIEGSAVKKLFAINPIKP